MSQTRPAYQRSTSGLIGAMIIVVVAVLALVGFQALGNGNEKTPLPTIDYSSWVKSGRADKKLHIFTPVPLPNGWRATSATYTTGPDAHWHLGILTGTGDYVGIEEALDSPADLVQQYVDQNATRGRSVSVGGITWQVWRDAGGDYALVRTLPSRLKGETETLLVVGSAPDAEIRDFAARLQD